MNRVLVLIGVVLLVLETQFRSCLAEGNEDEGELTAGDLLGTIAPTYRLPMIPPGFPPLHKMNTDKFDYNTGGRYIKVSTNFNKPIVMVKDYIELSEVGMNFTYDKKQPRNGTWKFSGKGTLALGSELLPVSVTEDGVLHSSISSVSLQDIVNTFDKDNNFNDTNVSPKSITLTEVRMRGKVWKKGAKKDFYLQFYGRLTLKGVSPIYVAIKIVKYTTQKLKLYSIMEFSDNKPSKVLQQIMNQESLNIPFFANLLSESDLLNKKQSTFGIVFSLTDVFNVTHNESSGRIIKDVLQSHVPSGITLLCSIDFQDYEDPIRLAFVIKRPTFDFLVDKHDRITLKRVLEALSSEFSPPLLPSFLKQSNQAFTSHISYNSDTFLFSLFVRLKDHIGLAPNVLRSNVSSVVLVRNASDSSSGWKMSVRGNLYIGDTTLRMQYSQLSNDGHEKVYGLTGVSKDLRLIDIVKEFKPQIYADHAVRQMIENTEIDDFTINKVNLFSRITKTNTPHILLTGFTSLPWEKQIRIALLLLSFNDKWYLKMAVTFVHSPLSNILEALTGFDSRNISLLHNTHIMTSIITSALRNHSFLPPKIITTPLLRLPIAKGITVIALLKFPDNCGDDKICQAAVSLLGRTKVYTLRGELSMDGFSLRSPHNDDILLGQGLIAENNTLEFVIGNDSRFDVLSSIIIQRSQLIFDGKFHIYKTGQVQIQMQSRKTLWTAPFGLHSLAFKDMSITTFYKPGTDLQKLKLEGTLLVGALGNGGEIQAPIFLEYNPSNPHASTFHSNISKVTLQDFMKAFTIHDTPLPYALTSTSFPNGLMVSYSSIDQSVSKDFEIHGDISILGRMLSCDIKVIHPGTILLTTNNSPAPVILGGGQIIVQQDAKNKLRGPRIFAKINHNGANVTMYGYVKVLGLEQEANISITDNGLSFEVKGKIMDYKSTTLKAVSRGSLEDFTVSGCFDDIPDEVQYLLLEIIEKAGNQSSQNMLKAEENLNLAQKYFDNTDKQEIEIKSETEMARRQYEGHLLEYGRFEVLVNDTCVMDECVTACFGCPEWNHCYRRDIFGECVSCPAWKKCCWRNIDPICIAKHDGCQVVLSIAEKLLNDKQTQMVEERIAVDKLEQIFIDIEMNKGKHQAVLEAAMDAKRLVIDDSSPGLNAAEAVKNFGPAYNWIKLKNICYNTTIQQAATGCMFFHITGQFSQGMESTVSIGSCLKEELVTELSESLANYIFPGIVDTSSDGVTDVKTEYSMTGIDDNGPYGNSLTAVRNKPKSRGKVEQDALYKRGKRDIQEGEGLLVMPVHIKAKRDTLSVEKSYKKTLLNNPFWEFNLDHHNFSPRSRIPMKPKHQQIMTGMIHKRWRIPDNPAGRCHIFHQLIDICKDMAETLLIMDKTLSITLKRYQNERRAVSNKVSSTDSFLSEAVHRLQLNISVLPEIDKTLQVVNQGVDIWTTKCTKELHWQNNIAVENWLRAMDLRIQELGGFGVYRFLENLFHAFEALFEASTYSDDNVEEALLMLQRIRKVSTAFDKIFKNKLSITACRIYAKEVMQLIDALKHETMFCS